MNSKFLTVHDAESGKPVVININSIQTIEEIETYLRSDNYNKKHKVTRICFADGSNSLDVIEPFSEVIHALGIQDNTKNG